MYIAGEVFVILFCFLLAFVDFGGGMYVFLLFMVFKFVLMFVLFVSYVWVLLVVL